MGVVVNTDEVCLPTTTRLPVPNRTQTWPAAQELGTHEPKITGIPEQGKTGKVEVFKRQSSKMMFGMAICHFFRTLPYTYIKQNPDQQWRKSQLYDQDKNENFAL